MSSSDLSKDFLRVPTLEAGGANWVIYKDRLRWAADARGFLGHLDGRKLEPISPTTPEEGADAATKKRYREDMKTYDEEMTAWGRGEAIMKQLVASTIPDSLFMKIRNKGTAAEIWQALAGDFEHKSRTVSVNL
ncbi:hypothetical protein BDW22DRAFT_1304602, partial [Trametopsis cervina]